MKPEDRTLLETHLLAQITSVEQEITKLTAERDTLRDLLARARRENSTLRDVTRKNSFDRILIESRILNLLKAASKPVPTSRLWWAAQEINPRLRNTTFRSHLHRLKSKGLIASENHGFWLAAAAVKRDGKSVPGGLDGVPLPVTGEID
jgi:Fe2+ or Zn2+ uptake regulation protein